MAKRAETGRSNLEEGGPNLELDRPWEPWLGPWLGHKPAQLGLLRAGWPVRHPGDAIRATPAAPPSRPAIPKRKKEPITANKIP